MPHMLSALTLAAACASTVFAQAFFIPDFPVNVTLLQDAAGNLTCEEGQVAYGYVRTAIGIPLSVATPYFSNWTSSNAVPGALVSSSGTGVGASRSYVFQNATYDQQLVSTNATEDGITLQWALTQPVVLSGPIAGLPEGENLTIYKNVEDVTFNQNGTSDINYLQYWSVGCYSNKTLGNSQAARGSSIYLGVFIEALSQLLTPSAGNQSISAANTIAEDKDSSSIANYAPQGALLAITAGMFAILHHL